MNDSGGTAVFIEAGMVALSGRPGSLVEVVEDGVTDCGMVYGWNETEIDAVKRCE